MSIQAVMVAWGELMVRQRFIQQSSEGSSSAPAAGNQHQERNTLKELEQYATHVLQQDMASGKARTRKGTGPTSMQAVEFEPKNFT